MANFPELGEGVYNVKLIKLNNNGTFSVEGIVARVGVTFPEDEEHALEYWDLITVGSEWNGVKYVPFAVGVSTTFKFERVGDFLWEGQAPPAGLGDTKGTFGARWSHSTEYSQP